MKDFLLVIPRDWRDFKIASLSAGEKLLQESRIVSLLVEDFNQDIPTADNLEIVIDYQGCHILAVEHNRQIFVQQRVDAVDFSYYLNIDSKKKKIVVSSCLFGILPLYYCEDEKRILVSNRARLIAERLSKRPDVNKKFLIEQALFNYSFQNDTIYQGIKLLATNSTLVWKGRLSIEKYLAIEDYYCPRPKSKNQTIDSLRDLFIAEVKKYFSIEKSALSFTSGYDGRTLLACSRYYQKEFGTYSFGAVDNDDIYVPQATARKLNIPFQAMILDEDYARNDFFSTGEELMDLTDGNNSFLQVHHLYAAKLLAKDYDCLLNGMFGSELFRALHIRGQVTSRELVSVIATDKKDDLIAALCQSPKLAYFDKGVMRNSLDQVLSEVADYKENLASIGLNKSQQFYKYIFEEAFRKIFGYFITPQLKYVNIRSPFLNFNFIKELFKSELAGINNDFFTHNPLKRLKGQLLYAKIIEKTDPELFGEKTTKGYSPNDLLTFLGKAKVAYGYFRKKLVRKIGVSELNNLMILSGIKKNKMNFLDDYPNSLFAPGLTKKILDSELDSGDRDIKITFLSMKHFLNDRKWRIQ